MRIGQSILELDFQTRLLGPAARVSDGKVTGAEIGDIVARLLLFETYILDSLRFREIPYLVSAFSADGLRELIMSGALQIRCEPLVVANAGQNSIRPDMRDRPPLPLGSYAFRIIRIAEFNDFVHRSLQPLHEIEGVPHKSILRLKKTIASNLVRLPTGIENELQQEMMREFTKNPALFRAAVDIELKRKFGSSALTVPVRADLEEIEAGDYRFETDIREKFNTSRDEVHNIGQAAGFAVGVLMQRLTEMRAHSALNGFSQVDTELVDKKFSLLARVVAPEAQERRFKRVISLSGFPDVRLEWGERVINVDKLLKVRESDECRAFRDWLRSTDELSDNEITELVKGLRAKLGLMAGSESGKIVRFLASTSLSLLGTVPGVLSGLIDSFIAEKLFPKKGIIAFVSNQFPSIFEYPAAGRPGPSYSHSP